MYHKTNMDAFVIEGFSLDGSIPSGSKDVNVNAARALSWSDTIDCSIGSFSLRAVIHLGVFPDTLEI